MAFGRYDFSCQDCKLNWLFGTSGTCDLQNKTCICPHGFSGKDDIVLTQTCHINESAVLIFHQICFFVSIIVFMTNMVCFFVLLKSRVSKNDKIRNLSLLSFSLGACSSLFFIAVYAIFSFSGEKTSFAEYKVLLPVLTGFGTCFLSISLTVMLYAWYKTLPNPKVYGTLLDYPSFIIMYHGVVELLFVAIAIINVTGNIICFFILPFVDKKEEYGRSMTTVFLFYSPLSLLLSMAAAYVTTESLSKLYSTALEVASPSQSVTNHYLTSNNSFTGSRGRVIYSPLRNQTGNLKDIIKVLGILRNVFIGSTVGTLTMISINLFLGGLYQYVFISGSAQLLFIGFTVVAVLTVRRTSGGIRMQSRQRHLNRSAHSK